MGIMEIFTGIYVFGTFVGLYFVYRNLKASHDWNRRKYALDMIKYWNTDVMNNAIRVESCYNHLFDTNVKLEEIVEITKEEAKKIYTCEPDEKKCFIARHAFNSLLNQFEYISTAYNNKLADSDIVHDSFKPSLIRLHDILINYIKFVEEHRGYQPWKPYIELVSQWKADEAKTKTRPPTG